MVGLTEKLMGILEARKDDLTGEDIKHIVESIQISESITNIELIEKAISEDKDNIKKQEELMLKMGKEYLYGGV